MAATRILSRNGFSKVKAKLNAGHSAVLVIWSDSTGNCRDNAGRWPEKIAALVAAAYPTHSVLLKNWNTTDTNSWDAATTVSTGSTTATLTIWNFAVTGAVPHYGMGSSWLTALGTFDPDGLILNHGINLFSGWNSDSSGVMVRGAIYAAIQQFLARYPDCPVSGIVQNPNRDATTLDNMPVFWKQVAARLDIGLVTAIYDAFIAAGKPSGYYADAVHPSEPTGNQIYADAVWAHWLAASTSNIRGRNPTLLTKGYNLLDNGGFKTWSNTAAAPDGWTASGTITFTKDTSVYADADFGYSVKMAGSGAGATYIKQTLNSTKRGYCAGKKVSFAVRKRVGVSGNLTVGQCLIFVTSPTVNGGSAVQYNTMTYVTRQGDFAWWALQGIDIPADVSGIEVRLYQDNNATPDTTNSAWYDQAYFGIGNDIALGRAA